MPARVSPFQLFTLAFGVAVGVGWIVVMGDWLRAAGPLGAALAFAVATVAVLAIGFAYAVVAPVMREAGGEYAYAKATFGKNAAFWVGWFLVLSYTVVLAFEIVSLGWVGRALLRLPDAGRGVDVAGLAFGAAALGVTFVANVAGAGSAARLQDGLVVLKILVSLALIGLGVALGRAENLAPLFGAGAHAFSPSGFLSVLAMAPFFFAGFGVIAQAMVETGDDTQARSMPLVVSAVIIATGLFYIGVILSTAAAAPRALVVAAGLPAAAAFEHLTGQVFGGQVWGGQVVLALGLLGLLTTLNGMFFADMRIVAVLAREKFLPAILGATFGRREWPIPAALVVALFALAFTLIGRSGLSPFLNIASAGICAVMGSVCLVALVLLRRKRGSFGAFLAAGAGLFVSAAMTALPMIQARAASGFPLPLEWIVTGAWIALGLFLGFVSRRSRRGQIPDQK